MKPAVMLRVVLLFLVAASVGAWAWKTWREPRAADASGSSAQASPLLADGVTVVNFHGTVRCPSCLQIGTLSQAVVAEEFSDEAREGRVAWVSLDFDRPENAHFKEDYDLVSSNVVVVRRALGKELGWSRLDEVWSLNDDEPAFREYVHAAVDEALKAR